MLQTEAGGAGKLRTDYSLHAWVEPDWNPFGYHVVGTNQRMVILPAELFVCCLARFDKLEFIKQSTCVDQVVQPALCLCLLWVSHRLYVLLIAAPRSGAVPEEVLMVHVTRLL